ncbi:MAG: restriction endonuclease subunit S [Polaromonas sp.]|uniref:restriction endonuclease subunit S n=1 Tax=Polaromonas sp. TaxID=1869339 RepID=UPI0025E058AD|nr:restriction endonuclease subunit S [Polaromonas sp.]MBI2726921.1 restriction endonuclease subunit S [Polaromonas sp.]
MSKTQPLSALFKISGGHQLSKAKLKAVASDSDPVAYVSRTHRRNGLDGWTAPLPGLAPSPSGSITVCLRSRNHALASFVQPFPFYTSFHVAVLTPFKEMSEAELLWWCKCIEQNRFRFNFGRQANRTLGALLVPAEVPQEILELKAPVLAKSAATGMVISMKGWPLVNVTDLFDLLPGKQTVRRSMQSGDTPWVSGSAENNGITAYVDKLPEFEAGCLTVANNGSIGSTFYQPDAFTASSDVTVLKPKFKMSVVCALFICALLRKEAFRYNYARKWTMGRMLATRIPFPLKSDGIPHTSVVEEIMRLSPYAELVDA